MSLVNRTRLRVEWGDCDPAGIVFNSRLFEYFDAGSWSLFEAALGVAPCELAHAFGIMGIPLVDARARIVTPLKFGDAVEVVTNVSAFRRSSFDVQHRLLLSGDLAVEGSETRVWAEADRDDPAKLRSRPIPPSVIARFRTG